MIKELTCIICPMGCRLKAEVEGTRVISVEGNGCMRGAAYAETECINPRRVLTTTVRCGDGKLLAVKTDAGVPKKMLMECMQAINNLHPALSGNCKMGDVICENILGTGANVVIAQ